jgi:cytochrome-b5 reductase
MDLLTDNLALVLCAVLIVGCFYVLNFSGNGTKSFLSQQDRNTVVEVPLIFRENLSHDTVRFRFGLPSPTMCLGLPVGGCLKFICHNVTGVKAGQWNGRDDAEYEEEEVERKYTPVTSDSDKGYFEVVIKVYPGGVLPQFPDGGKMSQHMNRLKLGDKMKISGPWGPIEYTQPSTFVYMKKVLRKNQIGMIAGGSGITPMLQMINHVLNDPKDTSQLSLIYANKTEDDILLKDMLDDLAVRYPTRFHLHYTLDNPASPNTWKGSKGFVTEDMIEKHLPPPSPDTVILMCGPPPMIKFACKANLDKLGYAKSDQLSF